MGFAFDTDNWRLRRGSVPQRNQLSSRLKSQISELAVDLREFIRKRDYQYRHEPPGREHDSLLRAMYFLVGPNPCRTQKEKQFS